MTSDGGLDAQTGMSAETKCKIICPWGKGFHLQLRLLYRNRTPCGKVRLFEKVFPPPFSPNPSHVKHLNGTCHHTHVCGQHDGIIKTACCVPHFGSIHEPKCGKSEFRGARIRVCPEIEVGPQTLIRLIVAVTGPVRAPLPP
jgi:hypothetical protein